MTSVQKGNDENSVYILIINIKLSCLSSLIKDFLATVIKWKIKMGRKCYMNRNISDFLNKIIKIVNIITKVSQWG